MKDLADFSLLPKFNEFQRHICFPYDIIECFFFGSSVVLITITKRLLLKMGAL